MGYPDKLYEWQQLRSIHCYLRPVSFFGRSLPSYGLISVWNENKYFRISYQNAIIIRDYFIEKFGADSTYVCAIYDDDTKFPWDSRSYFAPYANRSIPIGKFSNPINWSGVIIFSVIAMIPLSLGIIGLLFGYFAGIIFLLLGLLLFLATSYSEIIHRPAWVEVRKDGITLFFRLGGSKNFAWSQIKYLLWNPRDKVWKSFARKGNCAVQFKGKTPYPIINEIGFAIGEAYVAATGKNPLDKTRR